MKIAYIILAHTDPTHIARLSNKITINTLNKAFIHVDKKVDSAPFISACYAKNNSSIIFIKNRVSVHWAGYSSIEATISSFSEIINTNEHFDRFVILQGLDYPLKSNKEIDSFFEANPKTEFIRAINETHSKNFKDKHKYRYYWCWDKKNLFEKVLNKIDILFFKLRIPLWIKKPYLKLNDNTTYEIYRGWAHFAITEDAVKYIIDFNKNHPEYNKYFQSVYSSDESYFHTILYNSKLFSSRLPKGCPLEQSKRSNENLLNLTYFEYPPEGVRVFKNKDEFEFLKKTNYLYFRKTTTENSKELLDYIDFLHYNK